jgi:light-regulated signal transduction histidine kinase (bacteriophytochrome)
VFERKLRPSSGSSAAQFASLDFGNIMTGFQANINWLEEVFQDEYPRDDVLDALSDIREAQKRLLWLCREATVLADMDDADVVLVPMGFSDLVSEAVSTLTARYGVAPVVEVASIPSTCINADSVLMVRLLERMIEAAMRLTVAEMSTEIRGFIEGDVLHFIAMVVTGKDLAEPGDASWLDGQSSPLQGIPIRFCQRVARLHNGRLNVRTTRSSIVMHLSLPVCREQEDGGDEALW